MERDVHKIDAKYLQKLFIYALVCIEQLLNAFIGG